MFGGLAGSFYLSFFRKSLAEIVIFLPSKHSEVQADICFTDQTDARGNRSPRIEFEAAAEAQEDELSLEDSTTYSLSVAVATLIGTLVSKIYFIVLLASKGKREAFAFVLDILVLCYSYKNRHRYVPHSNIYNCGYQCIYWKKIQEATNPSPPPPKK
jgi:hypothetical protein